jgi:hypothetical protein
MKLRSIFKFAIFWFLIYLLSCASGPKVKEIATLHYGDDDAEVVEILGEGSESLFFKLNGINYSYRYYTTALTDHEYALLFADGSLYAVSEDKPPFGVCINHFEWEECFRSAISEMQSKRLSTESGDYSNAITEEGEIQKARTGAVVIGTPALIVLWPIVVLAGSCYMADFHQTGDMERSRQKGECLKELEKIEAQLDVLYPTSDLNHVIDVINEASFDLDGDLIGKSHERIYDISEANRRIYGKHWACGDYSVRANLFVMYGGVDDDLVWASKNMQPLSKAVATDASSSALTDNPLQMYWNDPKHPDAKMWLCRSADTGYPEAQYRLGLLYENGSEGIPRDMVRAYMWYRISASTGNYMRAADQAQRIQENLTSDQLAQAEMLIQKREPGQCERDLAPGSTGNLHY